MLEEKIIKIKIKKPKPLSEIDELNKKIKDSLCLDTINQISDESLLDVYKKTDSVKNNISKLQIILSNNSINTNIIEKITNEYIIQLIPPGTKGVIRGNKFNKIVKNKLESINLDTERFELCFEKNCSLVSTDEKPDWYIIDKNTKKIIIGMNQLDFWSGGSQINRATKYLLNNRINTENSKLLCVICNGIELKTKNKSYKCIDLGFKNKTLCYINKLEDLIYEYFN